MPKDRRIRTGKKVMLKRLLVWAGFLAAALLIVYILVGVYVTKSLTWNRIFTAVGLGADTAAGYRPPQEIVTLREDEAAVHFLYAGQADCTIIRTGNFVVLVDAGEWFSKEAIFSFLDAYGITRIDCVFITHPHTDHMGSLSDIVRAYPVDQVYFTNHPQDITPSNATYTELIETLIDTGTPTRTVSSGMSVPLDCGEITVLYDPMNNDLNNCSMVLRYTYGDASFLLMGDAESMVEHQMIDEGLVEPSDVLKVGHHGTKRATTEDFLRLVRPAYAVISCGLDNEYGYPKEEVLQRLQDVGGEVLRTDVLGDIVFIADGTEPVLWRFEEAA